MIDVKYQGSYTDIISRLVMDYAPCDEEIDIYKFGLKDGIELTIQAIKSGDLQISGYKYVDQFVVLVV